MVAPWLDVSGHAVTCSTRQPDSKPRGGGGLLKDSWTVERTARGMDTGVLRTDVQYLQPRSVSWRRLSDNSVGYEQLIGDDS